MSITQQERASVKSDQKQLQDLESLIHNAIKKVGGKKENDLCRYLPMNTGGYMHHFTLRKMKTQQPTELNKLINQFIISVDRPTTVAPKQRAARGSRKRRDQITFNKNELDHMLRIARLHGDKDLVRKLTPKKDLKTLKKELISSIRRDQVDQDLWLSYCEVLTTHKTLCEGDLCSTTAHPSSLR